jgi:predicted amino acid dehydrogenase
MIYLGQKPKPRVADKQTTPQVARGALGYTCEDTNVSHLSLPFTNRPLQQFVMMIIMLNVVMVVLARGIDVLGLAVSGVLAYAIGTLPVGATLIRMVSGHDPRRVHAYTLGIENLYHFVGAPLALASFTLDIGKGAFALLLVGLMQPSGLALALVAVFVGHLYPLPKLALTLPRGRGGGVLAGLVVGLVLLGRLELYLALIPALAYLLGLTSRYLTVATLSAFFSLPVLLLASGHITLASAASLVGALALWRQKASLGRIINGLETKLGQAPAVHGTDPNVVYAAFMIHPMTLDDMWQLRSQRWLGKLVTRGIIPEQFLRRSLLWWRPQKVDDWRGITLADGRELRVLLLGAPMLPEQIRAYPQEALRMAIQGATLAREFGAESLGLGAYWSTVGNKGLEVQQAVPDIHITNGGAYTAAAINAALPRWLEQVQTTPNLPLCAAVVGANGVVAFGVARTLAERVDSLILIGRDLARVTRCAATLQKRHPELTIIATTDMRACQQAQLIVTATSSPVPVLQAEHIAANSWIYDLGRPSDVAADVYELPGVKVIPGGVVRPPGDSDTFANLDIHFGRGYIPACMAETMIMTATRAYTRQSLGNQTKTENMAFYLEQGSRLGFTLVSQPQPAPADSSSTSAAVSLSTSAHATMMAKR